MLWAARNDQGVKSAKLRNLGNILQVSFVPRSLAMKAQSSNGAPKPESDKKPEPGSSGGGGKSNADFRSMLLGKK